MPPLVLYDGLCGFCDAGVQWLLIHDKRAVLRFAALQSDTAQSVLKRHTLPEDLDSIILVEGLDTPEERVTYHSAAVFRLAAYLPAPWSWAAILRYIPRVVSDFGYRLFARNRYLVWGRKDACRIPTPAERARFLV